MIRTIVQVVSGAAVLLASLCIRVYQILLRPWLIGACKFHPTCSEYALESLTRHGLLRGGWLAARRVVRCVPGTMGGYDPVPPTDTRPDRISAP